MPNLKLTSIKKSISKHISDVDTAKVMLTALCSDLQTRYDEASTAANLRTGSDKHIYFHLNEYEYNELINAKENTQIKLQSLLAKIEWFHVTYLEEKDFDELYEPEDLRCKEANITAVSLINKAMKFLHFHEMNKQYLGRSRNENVMGSKFRILSDTKPCQLTHTSDYGDFLLWFKSWIAHSDMNNIAAGPCSAQLSLLLPCLSDGLRSRVESKFDRSFPILDTVNAENLLNSSTNMYFIAQYFEQNFPLSIRRSRCFSVIYQDHMKASEFAEELNCIFNQSNFCGFGTTDNSSITVGELKVHKLVSCIPKSRVKEKLIEYLHREDFVEWEKALAIINEVELVNTSQTKATSKPMNFIDYSEYDADTDYNSDLPKSDIEESDLPMVNAMMKKYPWISEYKKGSYARFGAAPRRLPPNSNNGDKQNGDKQAAINNAKKLLMKQKQDNVPFDERACTFTNPKNMQSCGNSPFYSCTHHKNNCRGGTCNGSHPKQSSFKNVIFRIQRENEICAPISLFPKIPMTFHKSVDEYVVLHALCDSGASVSVISKEICDNHGLEYDPKKKLTLLHAGGGNINCYGSLSIPISFATNHQIPITLYVCDVSGIFIGLDDLKYLGVLPKDWLNEYIHQVSSIDSSDNFLKKELDKMINNEFKGVFEMEQNGQLKTIEGPEAEIHLKKDVKITPYATMKSRIIPLHAKSSIERDIQKYKDMGVFEEVQANELTEWIAEGNVVYKGYDQWRLITDFRALNSCVLRSPHGFLSAEQILQHIPSNAKYFFKGDAKSAYFQCKVSNASKNYLTFLLGGKRYRYLRLPQGFVGSSDQWCALSDAALRDLKNTFKLIDDIICFSETVDELLLIIRYLLQRCLDKGITLDINKLSIGTQIEFAGHIISQNSRRPSDQRMKAIGNYPVPNSATDVRSFVSLVRSAVSTYVPTLAKFTSIITPLTSSKVNFLWNNSHQEAFDQIKKILSRELLLNFYNPDLEIEIYCDASRRGIGFVAQQICPLSNKIKIFACGSRTITTAEAGWAIIELECLAILFSMKQLKFYVTGKTNGITVWTDHSPLVQILTKKSLCDIQNKRIFKMVEFLQSYTFNVKWLKGKNNGLADTLSRFPEFEVPAAYENELNLLAEITVIEHLDPMLEQMIEYCQSDDYYQELIEMINNGVIPNQKPASHFSRAYASVWDSISRYKEDLLLVDCKKLVVPPSYEKFVLLDCHKSHCGIVKALSLARSLYWFPFMKSKLENTISSCEQCQFHFRSNVKEPIISTTAEFVFQFLFSDHYTLFGKTFLVTVDCYSLYLWVHPVATDTEDVRDYFKNLFNEFGTPQVLCHNGASCFTSKEFVNFLKENLIYDRRSSPHFPESNSNAELGVQVCKKLHMKCPNWPYFLTRLRALRNTPSRSLGGLSPAQLFFGRRLRDGLPCHPSAYRRITDNEFESAEKERILIRNQRKKYMNFRRQSRENFKIGDKVLLQDVKTKKWSVIAIVKDIRESGRSYVLTLPGKSQTLIRNKFFLRNCPEELLNDNNELIKCSNVDLDNFDDLEFTFDLKEAEICDEKCSARKCKDPKGIVTWVQCDTCNLWYHLRCIGLSSDDFDIHKDFKCPYC